MKFFKELMLFNSSDCKFEEHLNRSIKYNKKGSGEKISIRRWDKIMFKRIYD